MTDKEIEIIVKKVLESTKSTNKPLMSVQLVVSILVGCCTIFLAFKAIAMIPSDIEAAKLAAREAKETNIVQDNRLAQVERTTYEVDWKVKQIEPRLEKACDTIEQINHKIK